MDVKVINDHIMNLIKLEIQGIYELGGNVPPNILNRFIIPSGSSSTYKMIESGIIHYSQFYQYVSDNYKCNVETSYVVLSITRILVLLKSARLILTDHEICEK